MINDKKELDPKYAGQIYRAIRKDDIQQVKKLLEGHLEYLACDRKGKARGHLYMQLLKKVQ